MVEHGRTQIRRVQLYLLGVPLAVDEHHPRNGAGVVLPPVTLLFPPLFIYPLLLVDVIPRPKLLGTVPVQEDRLKNMLL